ncbi:MAG: phage terminase large subunit family protein [Proteobacteria bacterium]|nr:phage terminase large subunit family protein [Pseudomonadota bacterium]
MSEIDLIGADWLADEVDDLTDNIIHVTPVDFNEEVRYLPESVTSIPGYIRFDVNPFMREIINCADVNSPVREVNIKKGVQITYTTLLESIMLYFMSHIKTVPMMYITADKELAKARIENNIIPMINLSGLSDMIRSSDEGSTRKTGKTADHLQWEGGGYMVPFGANNADKMRSYSIMVMLKDELDAWKETVGKDGDPDALSDDRCSGYWERRKIFRGSTPLIKQASKIEAAYRRGDQREYNVLCKACGFPQSLRWSTENKENGVVGGMQWETQDGVLVLESVRYCCSNCGEPHFEHDKELLFSEDGGAQWVPTATPVEPNIRSYHLPALYSPIGMQPWYKCVSAYLKGFDPIAKKVRDIGKYQVFYNNILAEPFEVMGTKVRFVQVSGHRRSIYRLGRIPNKYAAEYSGSVILFLTCQVDVHKNNLAVTVMGWTRDMRCYTVDYWRFEVSGDEDDCSELTSPVWGRLRTLIEETEYIADDGKKYRIILTLIDAGYANDTVTTFCSDYASGVVPILGRDRPSKNQSIKEFAEFKTQAGTIGYKIVVDHYKDRLSSVLRREWIEEAGQQPEYHFNAPVDITDKQLKELTVESRREKKDPTTNTTSYFWYRPGNARNELWDLLCYGHAAAEILAYSICIQHFKLESIEWAKFWDYVESEKLYYSE